MVYIKIKTKFPCGYETEVKILTLVAEMNGNFGRDKICPLHGKDCPTREDK